jgi:hypothetical protein
MSGSGPRAVFVSVESGHTTGAYPIPIQVENMTHHGNLTVVWTTRGRNVEASLHELR